MYLNPINSAVDERKKEGANHISMICTFSYSMSVVQSQRKLFQQSVLASDNLLMATDLADSITFHSTPQWFSPHLLSGRVLPGVQSCRLRDIFLHLPQMHLQSLQ